MELLFKVVLNVIDSVLLVQLVLQVLELSVDPSFFLSLLRLLLLSEHLLVSLINFDRVRLVVLLILS